MSVEDITESMGDLDGIKWYTVFDGHDFWRVRRDLDGRSTVYDYPTMNIVYDKEVVQTIKNRVFQWKLSQTNG